MNNLKKVALSSVLALSSVVANAEIITYGDLSTDAAYDVIADTERGREYLRFDTFDLTYAETVTATSSGGIYEDWSMADFNISDDFINAMFSQNGENACSSGSEINGEGCGSISGWTVGGFGGSHNFLNDHWAYVGNSTNPIGLGYISSTGNVQDYGNWSSISLLDTYKGSNNGMPINILLYRDNDLHLGGFNVDAAANNITHNSASVPLPATLGLLGLAMAGLSFRRKSV